MLFKLWLEHYLFTFKKSKVKNSTFRFYEERFQSLRPLYDIELEQLNIFDVQNFINELHSSGLSGTTIKHTFSLIEQACKKAVSCKIIKNNPCDGVELPKKVKGDLQSLSEFEVKQLLCCKERAYYYSVFLFLLYSGLRVGELIALEWTDIDFKNRVIHITRNFYRGDLSTPKTEQGKRDIPLTDLLLKLLPSTSACKGIVFKNTLNQRIDYHVLLTSWHRQQEAAHFKNCYGLHALRHTFASNLIHNGADVKTVSLLLGHKNIQITLDFYCHSGMDEKRQVISLLNYNTF